MKEFSKKEVKNLKEELGKILDNEDESIIILTNDKCTVRAERRDVAVFLGTLTSVLLENNSMSQEEIMGAVRAGIDYVNEENDNTENDKIDKLLDLLERFNKELKELR